MYEELKEFEFVKKIIELGVEIKKNKNIDKLWIVVYNSTNFLKLEDVYEENIKLLINYGIENNIYLTLFYVSIKDNIAKNYV